MKLIRPYVEIYDFKNCGHTISEKLEELETIPATDERMRISFIKKNLLNPDIPVRLQAKLVVDKETAAELAMHRLYDYALENPLYCAYRECEHDSELTFVIPECLSSYRSAGFNIWEDQMKQAERAYYDLLNFGLQAGEAKVVLPSYLKVEFQLTGTLVEWRRFFMFYEFHNTYRYSMRAMNAISLLFNDMKAKIPYVFDDIDI